MGIFNKILGKNIDMEMPAKEEKRVIGKIIKLHEKGYGFITSRDIEFTRIFFHWTSLVQNTKNFKELEEGMKVEFTPTEVPEKGIRAIKVRVVDNDKHQ